jgi:diguanylate cyclase (GGDEF)-like protein
MFANTFTSEGILSLALLAAAALTAAFFHHVFRVKRQTYLRLWAGAWSLLALFWLGGIFSFGPPESNWLEAGREAALALAAVLFFAAAQHYARATPWKRLSATAAVALVAWAPLYALGVFPVPASFGVAFVLFATAWIFWRESAKQESVADRLLTAAFSFWGAILLAGVFREQIAVAVGPATAFGASLGNLVRTAIVIPQMLTAVLMVMALYEEERRRIERNMLALSNLNLATSGFVGGEIQKMLAQALDRMLSVVRIPSGVLFLRQGEASGPKAVVAAGMSSGFCRAAQDEALDEHLVLLVAQLGGLVVFRDLPENSKWAALEREEAFRRYRALLVAEGMHTVVGISLQAKDRVFGVLLLATPDSRRFTPAELRLLLALGHQIGMAVENSYLIQQTSRRSEELNILNEIGRALSSTLDTSALFEKIFAEMRRLFDVSNFYIAFLDQRHNEIRFEIEVTNGVRLPKRTRPAGNHLTEFIIRTRQPVLIRENFVEEARALGVEPLQETGCFCGVPLVIYDRAVGVMGVHSAQERSFDDGHVELMRVLASEAAIAIENARLFGEEQRKSSHLALVNSISQHAITTLNPDEMLAKIAEELEKVLTYDHIGIGVLEYATKEVVILAEAGRRREAQGRHVGLGDGLVGHVARRGQMEVLHDAGAADRRLEPVLEGSASAAALPIVYADQLLGVLYVETSEPHDFTEEDLLLLRTLADLIAGALHNALAFQKAQEQAITDGLTGVKTHRFFMEALSAEWKRATRAGRNFSLVLIDLDRFKFVNDFYGHLEGDVVLQRVAKILELNCRRSDVVARYGGDEFVILMPETNIEQARQLANKLRAWVASDPLLREKNITASFGTACFPIHGSTPQELIQVADASMYLSKHQGGNAVSTAEGYDPAETQHWKRDVLEAYLGVTLKRLFSTGPEAFQEIHRRLEQFAQSLAASQAAGEPGGEAGLAEGVPEGEEAKVTAGLPGPVVDTVTSLAFAIDAKDHYTQGHSQKVAGYALLLAQALELPIDQVEEIRLAAVLHDVGKVGIPEAVLNKAGPLDASEWDLMKSHTELGARILAPLAAFAPASEAVRRIQAMVRHHHEFFDGSGYPDALAGNAIPLGARIIAIADAFDTITSDRTYKRARSMEEALSELERCGGMQFDPELIRVFLQKMRNRPAMGALLRNRPSSDAEPAEAALASRSHDAAPRPHDVQE